MKTYVALLAAIGAAFHCGTAGAGTPFGTTTMASHVFCDMPSIKGKFTAAEARYVASGTCIKLTAEQSQPNKKNTSQFDDYTHSTEDFRVQWTAEGGYNPTTKDTWETVTAPAPTLDKPSYAPYGRFLSKMICSADPWLDDMAKCVSVSTSSTGTLPNDLTDGMRANARPFTSRSKTAQRDALIAAKKRADVPLYTGTARDSGASAYQVATAAPPSIVEPKPGSTHSPQTAMRIRVAPPRIATPRNFKVQTYEVQIQARQKDGLWKLVTTDTVPAADAEGNGYLGWGAHQPGTPPAMTASVGNYRVRALIKAPIQTQNPGLNIGEWVEFVIAGAPGHDMAVTPYGESASSRSSATRSALMRPSAKV